MLKSTNPSEVPTHILAVNGNQGSLEEEVQTTCKRNRPVFDTCTVEKGHTSKIIHWICHNVF